MTERRRSVPIVQFALHPISGEMIALDARGNMWAGGRESVNGKTRVVWQKLGGIPDEFVSEDDGRHGQDVGDRTEYLPPIRKDNRA